MIDIVFRSCNKDSFILLKMKDGVIIDRDVSLNEYWKNDDVMMGFELYIYIVN